MEAVELKLERWNTSHWRDSIMAAQEVTETLLSAVHRLEPLIRESADEAERNRRLSQPVVTALAEAGLFQRTSVSCCAAVVCRRGAAHTVMASDPNRSPAREPRRSKV
jgi:hypothetical protein